MELLKGAVCEPYAPSGEELHTGAVSFFHHGVLDGRAVAVGEGGGREGSNRGVGRVATVVSRRRFQEEVVSRRRRWCLRRRRPHWVPAG
jgi:hypothetical protein